jgi:hypothetical protein
MKNKLRFRQCPKNSDSVKSEPKGDWAQAGPAFYSVLRGVSEHQRSRGSIN